MRDNLLWQIVVVTKSQRNPKLGTYWDFGFIWYLLVILVVLGFDLINNVLDFCQYDFKYIGLTIVIKKPLNIKSFIQN
jgi:hypothetical protein